MKLSQHFDLSEFFKSDTAEKIGIDNTTNDSTIISNMSCLCTRVLEPLRSLINMPIVISSGYRCEELNKALNGSKKSQHISGEAADIYINGVDPVDIFKTIKESHIIKFDQIILYPGFVHVSYRIDNNRNQVLYAKGVTPVY